MFFISFQKKITFTKCASLLDSFKVDFSFLNEWQLSSKVPKFNCCTHTTHKVSHLFSFALFIYGNFFCKVFRMECFSFRRKLSMKCLFFKVQYLGSLGAKGKIRGLLSGNFQLRSSSKPLKTKYDIKKKEFWKQMILGVDIYWIWKTMVIRIQSFSLRSSEYENCSEFRWNVVLMHIKPQTFTEVHDLVLTQRNPKVKETDDKINV